MDYLPDKQAILKNPIPINNSAWKSSTLPAPIDEAELDLIVHNSSISEHYFPTDLLLKHQPFTIPNTIENEISFLKNTKVEINIDSKENKQHDFLIEGIKNNLISRRIKIPLDLSRLDYIESNKWWDLIHSRVFIGGPTERTQITTMKLERECGFQRLFLTKEEHKYFQKGRFAVRVLDKGKFILAKIKYNI
jgi:hypothetical protein